MSNVQGGAASVHAVGMFTRQRARNKVARAVCVVEHMLVSVHDALHHDDRSTTRLNGDAHYAIPVILSTAITYKSYNITCLQFK